MMRLPSFRYLAPASVQQAARILADEGPGARIMAGGTDLLPNMKRQQQTPHVLVSLRNVAEVRQVVDEPDGGLRLGSGLTLAQVVGSAPVRQRYAGLWQAASQVASGHLRAMGTLGGNLCLDTRCGYYDQSYEWRKAIDFCMKCQGSVCWVATASRRCLAVSSTDCAPALISLGARVELVSVRGRRELAVEALYRNDGIAYLACAPDEILTDVLLPDRRTWRSSYWKLRRRGSFDFPVLGVAAAAELAPDGTVRQARIALGAVASCPILTTTGELLRGESLTDEVIEQVARATASAAKPMNNTDLDSHWRKRVVPAFVAHALHELRGEDMTATRWRVSRTDLSA